MVKRQGEDCEKIEKRLRKDQKLILEGLERETEKMF
jgi:hypothetical protein